MRLYRVYLAYQFSCFGHQLGWLVFLFFKKSTISSIQVGLGYITITIFYLLTITAWFILQYNAVNFFYTIDDCCLASSSEWLFSDLVIFLFGWLHWTTRKYDVILSSLVWGKSFIWLKMNDTSYTSYIGYFHFLGHSESGHHGLIFYFIVGTTKVKN